MSQAAATIYFGFAQLPKGKELGQVLQGQLAVLRVRAKNPSALQQVGSRADLPYAFLQRDELELHVLVFHGQLCHAETELNRVANGFKALACQVQRLGTDLRIHCLCCELELELVLITKSFASSTDTP
jgi:hypothetical protein